MLQDAGASLHSSPQEPSKSLAVKAGVTEADLIELRAFEVAVQIVFPGEADTTVHLQGRGMHSFRCIGAPDLRR